jgi:SAM-dependent methyltransferase
MTIEPQAFRPVPSGDAAAQGEFEAATRDAGYDPHDPWMGGYVDYEWDHLRLILDNYGVDVRSARVLEFGCNVAASSIVLAALGASVTSVDVDAKMIRIAHANVARYGKGEAVTVNHVPDTRKLPYPDASFDFILANSVLEYVPPDMLDAIVGELCRVAKPGATMLICGTASRLSPREVHSRRWLVNYVPRLLDPLIYGKSAQRGLSPFALSRALKGRFRDESGGLWAEGRKRIHGGLSMPMKAVCATAKLLGTTPGWLGPNIEVLLRRI